MLNLIQQEGTPADLQNCPYTLETQDLKLYQERTDYHQRVYFSARRPTTLHPINLRIYIGDNLIGPALFGIPNSLLPQIFYRMDIFSAPKRSKDDSIKKSLNYPPAEETQKKLKEDHQREVQQFNNFLKNIYMKFEFKVNKCKHTCISQATSYKDISECEDQCEQGAAKFSTYVDSRVQEMQQLLGDCVANANELHNSMDEIYYCYQMYNAGFSTLKKFITEESLYYE